MAVTWQDRQGWGRQLPDEEIARLVADAPVGGGLEWRHIGVVATLLAESDGFEWARPMVWKPGTVYHLSVDRGICQFNSAKHPDGSSPTYWAEQPDSVAYSPVDAIAVMVEWLHVAGEKRIKDSKPWDWRPLLDWQWHGYGGTRYEEELIPRARVAVNKVRVSRGLAPV